MDMLDTKALASNAGTTLLQSLDVLAKKTDLSSKIAISLKSEARRNWLSGYQSSTSSGNSRYIEATLNAFKTSERLKNSMDDDLFALVDQFGGINVSGTYYPNDDAASEAEIKAAVKRQGTKEIVKNADEDFKTARDAAEQQAAEEAAPKDAAGNPILIGVGTGGTASTDPAAATATVAANAAASAPAPTGDTATATETSPDSSQAATQQVAAYQTVSAAGDASGADASVDIVV